VNGKPATEYFTRSKDVENVIWPLQSLCVLGKYNVWVSTFGGGTTGQSEACKLAVARAVLAHDTSADKNLYRKVLRMGLIPFFGSRC
jgi:small subunit ribosomal protein S9